MCSVENEDVVGTAPTGDVPTTSEWSTILLPTEVRLILETLRYMVFSLGFCSLISYFPAKSGYCGIWCYNHGPFLKVNRCHGSITAETPVKSQSDHARHRTWSVLAKIMACCLMAPCLIQCSLIINKVPWRSPEDIIVQVSDVTNE